MATDDAGVFDMSFFFRPPEPLDPLSDETFDRWLCARDGRTLEEFAADGGRVACRDQ